MKRIFTKRNLLIALAVVVVVAGGAVLFFNKSSDGGDDRMAEATGQIWTCSMHPQVRLPKARQSLEVAQSGYVSGKVDFLNLLDAERTLLGFQLSEVEASVQRELALAELSLLILGTPPAGAPVLSPGAIPGKERKP